MPAITQTFLVRVLDEAISSPTTASFELLLTVVNGACAGILDTLPGEALHRLEKVLLGILKHEKAQDNSRRNVSSLALLAKFLTSRHGVVSSMESSNNLSPLAAQSSSGCDLSATAQVFNGTKASKILDLVASYVVFYCSEGCEIPTFEATASLREIITISRTLSEEVRQGWIRAKGQTLRKLCEKVLSTKINPQIRLWTIVFISTLCSTHTIPRQILAAYESLLLDSSILSMVTHDYCRILGHTLERMGPSLTSSLADMHLQKTFAMVANSGASLTALRNLQALAGVVIEIAQTSSSIRRDIFLTLCSNEFSPHLTTFMAFEPQVQDHTGDCRWGHSLALPLMNQRCNLGSVVCSMLLKLAFLARDDNDIGIDLTTASALVDKQATFHAAIPTLTHAHSLVTYPRATSPSLKQTQIPEEQQERSNWKTWLSEELKRRAKDQEDMIIRSVALACRGFEERCEHTEEPLRLQQEKAESLLREYNDATSHINELQAKLTRQETYISKLEAENSESHDRLQEAETAATDLEHRLKDLEMKLQETAEIHENEICKIQGENDNRLLAVEAAVATKDEAIKTRGHQIQELEDAHQALKNSLAHTVEDLEESGERVKDQIQQIEILRSEIEAEKSQRSDQNEACLDAYRKIDLIEEEANLMKSCLFSTEAELRELRKKHGQLVESSRGEIKSLRYAHQTELNCALSKVCVLPRDYLTAYLPTVSRLRERQVSMLSYRRLKLSLQRLRRHTTWPHARRKQSFRTFAVKYVSRIPLHDYLGGL